MSVVIGIAGGSGSGKTTVQRRVMERFGTRRIALLDHDAYYRPLDHLSPEQRARFNFDHPDALESDLMVAHLDRLIAGEAVEKPTYSFETHSRLEATQTVEPRPVVLVEGILVLAEPALRERMDVKLFVDAAPDVRLMRRMERDLHERGRSVESVLEQYRRTVRPMHLEFVEPSKRHADVIIPRGGQNQVAIDMVLARVQSLLDLDARG
ncbi:uridine kinase [Rubrivirga sp. SAORIC476]|uniref:uridine kinase n=1 Tax=Rubrivirga sp. SAORIC476 TaxID=1961794 RepID=UPI000BA97E7F|nr:uridine kinase [Rubrivirga sp. SAORIC476]PAP79091.1 uridine kinase [Rubrivirga sp. SAORIC476]